MANPRPRELKLFTFDEVISTKDKDLIMDSFQYDKHPEDLWFILDKDYVGMAANPYDLGERSVLPIDGKNKVTYEEIIRAFKDHDFTKIYNAKEHIQSCKEGAEMYLEDHMFKEVHGQFDIRAMKYIMVTYPLQLLYKDSIVLDHGSFADKIHAKVRLLPSYASYVSKEPVEVLPDAVGYEAYLKELNEYIAKVMPDLDPVELDELYDDDSFANDAYDELFKTADVNLTYFYIYLSIHMPELVAGKENMVEKHKGNDNIKIFISKMRYLMEVK